MSELGIDKGEGFGLRERVGSRVVDPNEGSGVIDVAVFEILDWLRAAPALDRENRIGGCIISAGVLVGANAVQVPSAH